MILRERNGIIDKMVSPDRVDAETEAHSVIATVWRDGGVGGFKGQVGSCELKRYLVWYEKDKENK